MGFASVPIFLAVPIFSNQERLAVFSLINSITSGKFNIAPTAGPMIGRPLPMHRKEVNGGSCVRKQTLPGPRGPEGPGPHRPRRLRGDVPGVDRIARCFLEPPGE